MKMLYLSVTLMLALLGATAYLAMQARDEAVKANVKMDLFTQQQRAVAAQNQSAEVQLPPPEAPKPAPVAITSAPAGSLPAGSPTVASPVRPLTAAAGSPAVVDSPARAPIAAEVPLTPGQRLVKNAPSIAKVKEFVADQGFVVLSAGSKQGLSEGVKFDLRRDASIVGRIKISSVDDLESIANLDFKSVPAGVTVQAGDEVIGMVRPN